MNLSAVSISDWITLAVGVLGFISACLSRQNQLPKWAKNWLKKIGYKRIVAEIEQADTIVGMSPEGRRQVVIEKIQRFCREKLGLDLPDSIANLLIEFVYQVWKRGKK